jgi:hypothetical protein
LKEGEGWFYAPPGSLWMKLPEPPRPIEPGCGFQPDLDKLHQELEQLGPEIQRSVAGAQAEAAGGVERAMRDMQKEMERAQRERGACLERTRVRAPAGGPATTATTAGTHTAAPISLNPRPSGRGGREGWVPINAIT